MAGASIADVAALAGVSESTVSQALNGNRPVSAKTHAKVQAAIDQLGYRPNRLAAGLRSQRTHTKIGRAHVCTPVTRRSTLFPSTTLFRSPVSAKTHAKVQAAIDQLGYRPNRLAAGLRSQRTHTIALVLQNISNPFYPAFARGAQDALYAEGYQTLICSTDGHPEL